MPFSLCCSTHGIALCNDRQGAYRTKSLESIDYMEGGKQVKLMDPNMLRYGGSASCCNAIRFLTPPVTSSPIPRDEPWRQHIVHKQKNVFVFVQPRCTAWWARR